MTTPATESFSQARQGSVAAIIQVLNERLSSLGIRTRAVVVSDGTLQLLCEAATPEQLEKEAVVERVRSELETISPQRIKRVKINSRIVKEDQLLWLEEINRDPEKALLWSEVITLKRPFFVKRWIRDRHLKPAGPIFKDITEPEPPKSSLLSKVIGGAIISLLLLAMGWIYREDLGQMKLVNAFDANDNAGEVASPEDGSSAIAETVLIAPAAPEDTTINKSLANQDRRAADTTPPTVENLPTPASNGGAIAGNTGNAGNVADAFVEAVRIAEAAGVDGKTASTAAEWLDLAARWQKASDLMGDIPVGNKQYAIAQTRIKTYQANSKSALQKASAAQAQ